MTNPSSWAPMSVLLMSLAARPLVAAAEPLSMPAETVNAFQAFAEATQQLTKAKAAMAAIEAGEKPKGRSDDWSGVISGYETAAEAIKRSGGPSVPDASAYGVPLEQIRSCATRQSALGKLDKQLRSLHGAAQQLNETRAFLKSRSDLAHAADDIQRYLVKSAAKLADKPLLGEVFTWSWPEVETRVSRSISAYSNELKRYQDRVDRSSAELKARSAVLTGELETFGSAKECLLAGHWVGSKSQGGTVAGMTLHLVSSGSSFTGNANLDGRNLAVRSVAISGSAVSVSFEGRASMKGTLSADGRSYHGSLSSVEGPGSFTLVKQ
jgi:hypothetical protein